MMFWKTSEGGNIIPVVPVPGPRTPEPVPGPDVVAGGCGMLSAVDGVAAEDGMSWPGSDKKMAKCQWNTHKPYGLIEYTICAAL